MRALNVKALGGGEAFDPRLREGRPLCAHDLKAPAPEHDELGGQRKALQHQLAYEKTIVNKGKT